MSLNVSDVGTTVGYLSRYMPRDVARSIAHSEKVITSLDALRRVVENGFVGKYYFKPSMEEYEACLYAQIDFRNLLNREGFAFHVILPRGLQKIRRFAFTGCSSIVKATFPKGLRHIEGAAFSGCTSLAAPTFPNGLRRVDRGAFSGCNILRSVILPQGCCYKNSSFPSSCRVRGSGYRI